MERRIPESTPSTAIVTVQQEWREDLMESADIAEAE